MVCVHAWQLHFDFHDDWTWMKHNISPASQFRHNNNYKHMCTTHLSSDNTGAPISSSEDPYAQNSVKSPYSIKVRILVFERRFSINRTTTLRENQTNNCHDQAQSTDKSANPMLCRWYTLQTSICKTFHKFTVLSSGQCNVDDDCARVYLPYLRNVWRYQTHAHTQICTIQMCRVMKHKIFATTLFAVWLKLSLEGSEQCFSAWNMYT